MDKTFAAIEKLKEVELELHRLKNYAEMMNRSVEAKREWQGLTDDEVKEIYRATEMKVEDHWRTGGTTMMFSTAIYQAIEQALQEKNT